MSVWREWRGKSKPLQIFAAVNCSIPWERRKFACNYFSASGYFLQQEMNGLNDCYVGLYRARGRNDVEDW
jgi:hypothetical protein